MSAAVNKVDTIKQLNDVWSGKLNISEIRKLIDPEIFVYHSPLGDFKGEKGLKYAVEKTREAFPHFNSIMNDDDIFVDGDTVRATVTENGTFESPVVDNRGNTFAPTNKPFSTKAALVVRFNEAGKAVEAWASADVLNMYQLMDLPRMPKGK